MVERFINNDFLWNAVLKDEKLLKQAMKSHIEHLILNHPYLKEDAYICSAPQDIAT